MTISWFAIPIYSIPSLIATVAFAGLGLFIFLNRPRTPEKIIFSVLCFCTFYWELVWFISFFVTDDSFLTYLAKIVYFTITPLPFIFYHFIAAYLKRDSEKKYIISFYTFAILLIIFIFPTDLFIAGNRRYEWGNFSRPGPLYIFFVVGAVLSMLRGLVILRRDLRRSALHPDKQNQLKYLLLGFTFYFFCALDFFQVYGAKWFPIGTFFFLLSFVVIGITITRHHLMDVRVVIRKTLFYSTITALISLMYISLVFVFHSIFLRGETNTSSFVIGLVSILFVAITFKPIEIVIHRFVEKKFFQGTISEIAEQKQKLESELERQERLKSVGILAAGMAHEIKNPITAIKTFAEYLPKKYDDPEFREKFAKIIHEETERISRIVKDLLLFSKPSEPNRQTCDLHQIIKDVTDLLSSDILKSKIILQMDLDSSAGECHVDSAQIKQAFLNVLMNAIDAMPTGGTLTVTTSLTSDLCLLISISDTGCGIPKDKIEHIFDPFYTSKEQGTGLGLAITHSIIEKNGGKIKAESEIGIGTTFTITLPTVR